MKKILSLLMFVLLTSFPVISSASSTEADPSLKLTQKEKIFLQNIMDKVFSDVDNIQEILPKEKKKGLIINIKKSLTKMEQGKKIGIKKEDELVDYYMLSLVVGVKIVGVATNDFEQCTNSNMRSCMSAYLNEFYDRERKLKKNNGFSKEKIIESDPYLNWVLNN